MSQGGFSERYDRSRVAAHPSARPTSTAGAIDSGYHQCSCSGGVIDEGDDDDSGPIKRGIERQCGGAFYSFGHTIVSNTGFGRWRRHWQQHWHSNGKQHLGVNDRGIKINGNNSTGTNNSGSAINSNTSTLSGFHVLSSFATLSSSFSASFLSCTAASGCCCCSISGLRPPWSMPNYEVAVFQPWQGD